MIVTVWVHWTSVRPVVTDQHLSLIAVEAPDEIAGALLAAQWVASKPECVMPTRTEIESVVI